MGLDDIILDRNLTADLYKKTLIGEAGTVPGTKSKDIKILGQNEKSLSIIVNCDEAPFLPDAHLGFLIKMLAACGYSIADVAIVNSCGNEVLTAEKLQEELSPIKIIFFDVSPESIGFPLNFPHYQVQSFNQMKLLTAPSLGHLESNSAEKNKLWISLQKMFDINAK